jgi:hypothetical protein
MSNIDYRQHFLHAVNGLRTQGLSTAEIIALVIGDAPRSAAAPAASVEPVRMVSIELANGMTKNVPWTPDMAVKPASRFTGEIDTHAVTNASYLTEWVKPENFVPDVVPVPAPKPVISQEHEIVFVKSRGTSFDTNRARYEEEWVPPADHGIPTDAEQAELDALTADAEREIAELEATLAARRAEHAQFRTAIAGSDAS